MTARAKRAIVPELDTKARACPAPFAFSGAAQHTAQRRPRSKSKGRRRGRRRSRPVASAYLDQPVIGAGKNAGGGTRGRPGLLTITRNAQWLVKDLTFVNPKELRSVVRTRYKLKNPRKYSGFFAHKKLAIGQVFCGLRRNNDGSRRSPIGTK